MKQFDRSYIHEMKMRPALYLLLGISSQAAQQLLSCKGREARRILGTFSSQSAGKAALRLVDLWVIMPPMASSVFDLYPAESHLSTRGEELGASIFTTGRSAARKLLVWLPWLASRYSDGGLSSTVMAVF